MKLENISNLVEEAHGLLNVMSIFEIIDLDRKTGREVLSKKYSFLDSETIEKYLDVVE